MKVANQIKVNTSPVRQLIITFRVLAESIVTAMDPIYQR